MEISCAFGPSLSTPDHVVLAEDLGYSRAWIYDSPAVYLDPWSILSVAATRTERIGLAVGMLTPALRHPLVTAAAIATAEGLAPGRIAAGIGAGASSRWLLDEKPMRWRDVEEYVAALKGLLAGEVTQWHGKVLQMLHPEGWGPARPLNVPLLIGAEGPKGLAVARKYGDGVSTFVNSAPQEFDWIMRLVFATELEPDESAESDRVHDAVGPISGLGYHAAYSWHGADAVRALPAGEEWLATVTALPERERHLHIHAGHGVTINDIDRHLIPRTTDSSSAWVGSADEIRLHIGDLKSLGVTEVTFQPGGRDIERELRTFAQLSADYRD
ncbi:LLM class flavin-dependent oxidoreductase (plasmid) [Rhodococcus qingshengii]|uniref:LLM class flavin-dependent oxidoreductase n=1 Tax=Rhodococcus qingshengii TaxID=334542 RepID=UPI001E468E92|nr:LLM class flavin-dependent oxidoreductase [Rhodococcus qingshengii]UGQ55412.1 LLM class flavin-dependent oxidoreductase [Rhodococcus qingshengii]